MVETQTGPKDGIGTEVTSLRGQREDTLPWVEAYPNRFWTLVFLSPLFFFLTFQSTTNPGEDEVAAATGNEDDRRRQWKTTTNDDDSG